MLKSNNYLSDISTFFVKNRWPWHAAFWLLHFAGRIYSYYLTVLYYPNKVLFLMLFLELVFVGLVYLTVWLYKRLSRVNLLFTGILIWIAYVTLLSFCQNYFLGSLPEMEGLTWANSFIGNIVPFMITFFLLLLSKYFKDSFIQQWYNERQEKLQLQSELQNLKAQVSPHFLFNTMNNFYGLAVEKSNKLPDLMVRLSDLLRYSLYETQSATVPLNSEISYLKNYIELEKIRLEDDLNFDFKTNVSTNQNYNIAPLLLIVLVENAFKHAKNLLTEPIKIDINLSVDENGKLNFLVANNCLKKSNVNNDEKGIGLENLKRRLEVLYPSPQHQLVVEHKEDLFKASLNINLENIAV